MKGQSIGRILYNYFGNHWLTATYVAAFPLLVTIVTSILGNPNLVIFSKIVLIGLTFVCVLFILLKNYGTKENITKSQNTGEYYRLIIDQLKHSRKSRASHAMNMLEDVGKLYESFKSNGTQIVGLSSDNQIEEYCNGLCSVLAQSFDISTSDIGISIIYKELCKQPESNDWKLLYNSQLDNDLKIDEIVKSEKSTFSAVINTPGSIYIKEKENAEKEGKYLPTPKEKQNGLKGSIICQNISLKGQKYTLPIILTFTTYEKKLCCDNDESAIKRISDIFEIIGENISCEILEDYIDKHAGLHVKI